MVARLKPPAPQSAPAPAPVAAVLEPPAASAPAGTPQLPALSASDLALFSSFGAGAATKQPELVDGPTHPYVFFWHEKSGDARAVVQKFPQVNVGDPILKLDGAFYDAYPFPFTILRDFQYWIVTDTQGKPVSYHLEGAPGRKEQIETILLLLTPEPVLTLTNLRTTKSPIAKDHRKAVAEAQTPAALARDPALGAMAGGNFPPAFRIMSKFKITPKAGKNPYAKGEIITSTTNVDQAKAILGWFSSAEGKLEVEAITKAFEARVEDVKRQAK